MDTSLCMQIARLRLLVGYLGEHHQYNWWPSAFLTPSSMAFLAPIFSKTAFMAQYQEKQRRPASMMSILVLGRCIISFACQNVLNKRSTSICRTKRSWTPYVSPCTIKTRCWNAWHLC